MKVIEFIKNKGLERLKTQYGIKINKYDDRIVLNYTQIDSPKTGDIVRECRGLILSWPDLNVLCRSFDRFYNYKEAGTSNFDFSKAVCFEKLDGTLVNLYHDGQKWNYATRQMAYAEGNIGFGDVTFNEAIQEILPIKQIYNLLIKERTYIFEFTSPKNRIVTKYNKPKMTLLAVMEKQTGKELSIEKLGTNARILNVDIPKVYTFYNYNMIMEEIRKLPKLEEGYVCLNIETGERIKVKNPSYLAVAHLRQDYQLSKNRVMTLIIEGGDSEYLEDFPEDYPVFEPYRQKYLQMLHDLIYLLTTTRNTTDQKEFAMLVKDSPVAGLMFQMKKGQLFKETLNKMTYQAKIRMLEEY